MDGHSHPSASAFVRGAFEGGLEGHAIDVVARSVADSLGAARVLIVGRTAPGSVPYLIAAWERADAGVPPAWTRGTVTERAFESAAPVVVRERVDGTPAIGISEIAVTVRAREDSIGAIYASFSPPTAFDDDDIGWRLETYSRVAALCMA